MCTYYLISFYLVYIVNHVVIRIRYKILWQGVAVWKMFFSTGQDLENAMKAAMEMLQSVEKHGLGEKKFFNGDDIGLVDLAFRAIAYWLQVLEYVMGVNDGCRS